MPRILLNMHMCSFAYVWARVPGTLVPFHCILILARVVLHVQCLSYNESKDSLFISKAKV